MVDRNQALLTYREVAKTLRVSERTIWTLVKRGVLPVVRFGKSVRIDPGDLAAFIARSKTRVAVDSADRGKGRGER